MNANKQPSLSFRGSLLTTLRIESDSQYIDCEVGERGWFTVLNEHELEFRHENWAGFKAKMPNNPALYILDPAVPATTAAPNAILLEDVRFESETSLDYVDLEAGYPIYFEYKHSIYHPDEYKCTDVLGSGMTAWLNRNAVMYTRPKEDILEGNYHMWHVFPKEDGKPWKILPNHNLRQLCLKGAERPGGFGFIRTNQIDAIICHPVYEQSAHVLGMQPNQEFIPDEDARMVWWLFDTGHLFVGEFASWRVLYDFVATRRWRYSEVFKFVDTAFGHEFTLNQLTIYNAEHKINFRRGVNRE